MLSHFDTEILNCVSLLSFQRSMPRVSNFQLNENWDVIVKGQTRVHRHSSKMGIDATVPLGESRERYDRVVVPGVDQVSW